MRTNIYLTRTILVLVLVLLGLSACVSPGPVLHHFAIEAATGGSIGNQAAGAPFNIKIIAQDASNQTLTSFTGKVNITSTGTLSAGSGTTAAFVAGVLASHSVTLSSQGSFTLTATLVGGKENGTSGTIAIDAAPTVVTTVPLDGATAVALGSSLTLNFSEDVNATTDSISLECPAGTAKTFSMNPAPASSFVLTPTGGLPSGITCAVKVVANKVSDADANDPPDTMAADHTFSFTTAAASTATSTITANPTSIAADGSATSSITVQLKDADGTNLTSSGGTIALSTTTGTLSAVTDNNDGTYTATLTAPSTLGSTTITGTLNTNPLTNTATVNFVAGTLHHFKLEAQGGGNIANQAVGLPFNIQITAQDASNHTVSGFSGTVDIGSSGTLSAGGGTTAAFVNGVLASHSVTFSDQGDITLTATRTGGGESGTSNAFNVDGPPTLSSTTPANAATDVPLASTITLNFSEGVNATAGSFALECPAGTSRAFTLSASPSNTFTLIPTLTLPPATECQVRAIAAQISDVDPNDPPDTMAADHTFTFTTAAASTVTSTIAANPTSIVANPSATSTIAVQLKDPNGTNLTSSGGTVALSTTAGTLSAVTDNNNGTYTATLTAPTVVGSATISGTLNGNALTNTATVNFVAGALHHFAVEAQAGGNIANQIEGVPFNIKIAAQDANNNTVTGFTGTVNITSTGTLSAGGGTTAAFVAGVLAPHSVTIGIAGTFTLTATHTGGATGTSNPFGVVGVNKAPSFSKGADQTALEDAATQSITGWATNLNDGDAEATQSLSFVVTSDNNALFSAQPAVSSTGELTYTPAPNANGSATVSVQVKDDGGTANGGVDISAVQTFTITVTPVNDAPSFTKGADIAVLEDAGAQTVNGWATAIARGPADEVGQTLSFNITGNTNPTLFSTAPTVSPAGVVSFSPAANANGTATITLVLNDNGGTANGGTDTSASQSFVIAVTPVNDVPSFIKGADQVVNEDAAAQTVNGWATAISTGPANESAQTVSFLVSNNNNGLFSVQPAVSPTGVLTYTPAANQNGSATVSAQIKDNGGTANGGVDTSAIQTFSITVNAVNDPPVAQTKAATAHTNMKIVGIYANLLTGVTDPDSGINGCTPTFSVASINTGTNGTVSNVNLATGTFDFDPNPGFTGTATATYTVSDNGCPAPAATSAPATINITVSGPVIWFVDPNVTGPGDGRLSNPFKFLSGNAGANNDADDVDGANHRIFLYSGTHINGIGLSTGEWLIGQGASGSFDSFFSITPPVGTITRPSMRGARPTVQNTVTLHNNAKVQGFNINSGANTGLNDISPAVSGATVQEVNIISTTAPAVSLTNASVDFLGGNMAINSTSGTGFSASSGGIINVQGSGNTITSTAGTAVSLNGIGGTLSFTSVSASGGANGIFLQNTTGSFSITDTGSAGSGGTILNSTATGIVLNNAQSISLSNMNIQNSGDDGINASSVNGFSLNGVNVTNNGNSTTDEGIEVLNPVGAMTFTNVSATGNAHNNIFIDDANNTGGNSTLTLSGGIIGNHRLPDPLNTANTGMLITIRGTATLGTSTISGATFENNRVLGLQVTGGDTATISDLTISGNTFRDTGTGNTQEIALDVAKAQSSNITVKVLGNTVTGHNSHGMNFFTGADILNAPAGIYNARIEGNTIGTSATAGSGSRIGNCMRINVNGGTDTTILVNNNTMRECPVGRGLEVIGRNGTGGLDITVTNNNINHVNLAFQPGASDFPLGAILVQSNCIGVCNTVRADVRGNTVPSGTSFDLLPTYIALVESSGNPNPPGTSTLQLVDSAPASADCTAQLTSTNTGSAGANAGCALIPGPISTPP